MERTDLEDFIELAAEIAADSGMPILEALYTAIPIWLELRGDAGPALMIDATFSTPGGLALAA